MSSFCKVLLVLIFSTLGKAVVVHNSSLNAVATLSARCPCKFVIIVPRVSDALDFSVSKLPHSGKETSRNAVEIISRYSQNLSHAFAVNDSSAFHEVVVPFNVDVRLSVFSTARAPTKTSRSSRSVQILKIRSEVDSCPVLLPQHPPRKNTTSSRIVGGSPANEDLTRYMAVLGTKNYDSDATERDFEPYCTGVIISPRHIVTAAHCLVASETIIVIGSADTKNQSLGERVDIESVHIHPEYQSGLNKYGFNFTHDIAYVTVTKDISPSFGFMQINIMDTAPLPGSLIRNIGYGRTSSDSYSDTSAVAYQIDKITSSNSVCEESFDGNPNFNGTNVFCAGYPYKDGCGACYGDSGGPVIQYDLNGAPVLVGIVTAGKECGDSKSPYLCTKIAAFSDFLPSSRVTRTDGVRPEYYSGGEQSGEESDPALPSDAVFPSNPALPSNAVLPTDPVSPSIEVLPSDQASASDAVFPSDSGSPSSSISPSNTAMPSNPVLPSYDVSSSDPVSPSNAVLPSDSDSPSDSIAPAESVLPSDAASSSQSVSVPNPTSPPGSVFAPGSASPSPKILNIGISESAVIGISVFAGVVILGLIIVLIVILLRRRR